jgi:hypothetical protein
MITILRNIFLNHWERKLISLLLAVVIWLVVNHSLTTTRTLDNISVRLINIPTGMTVEGLQPNGMLSKKISITLQGNKTYLAELTPNDFEIVLDAMDKSGVWQAPISRKNLMSLNPDIDLIKTIKRVVIQRMPVEFTRLVTEKIPVIVTSPIGEGPRDYQFLDVWPYHLSLTVSGPEEMIKDLKIKGLSLTFNLNDISRSDLEAHENKSDEISFYVPDHWKYVSIDKLSDRPFKIDDPQAEELRIDFVKNDLHALAKSIPISLFFPAGHRIALNPELYSLSVGGLVQQFHGIHMIRKSLYAKGVSHLFVKLVQDMLQISVLVVPKTERSHLDWTVQFQNARVLEDRYVSILMSEDAALDQDATALKRREEYYRNRFRNYMNRFQLYRTNRDKFDLNIEIKDQKIVVEEHDDNSSSH